MEKMRRVFPVLFVLVLLLFIPAAQAETTTISYFESLSWEITYDSTTAKIISLAAKNNDTGETFSGSQISFTQNDVSTPATCDGNGYIYFDATVQGVTYNISVSLDSLQHIWSDWIIDPVTGNHYKKCLRENCSGKDSVHEPKYYYYPPLGGPELSRTKHSKKCSICEIEITEDHQFEYTPKNEVNHKKTCQLCNFSEQDVHNFSEWVPVDGQNKHTRICSDCRMAVTEDHHFKLLDVGDGNHIWKCNVCGAVQPGAEKEPHQYDTHKNVGNGCHNWACACGAVNPDTIAVPHEYSWTPDQEADHHWGTCSICGWFIYEGHDFSLIRNDETGHWKECICGIKETEPQPHEWIYKIGEDDLEGSHYQLCHFCEYPGKAEEHQYVLTDVGKGYHMWKCVCGAVKPETKAQEHEYGNWTRIEGTNTHKGVCACGAESTVECSGGTATCMAKAVCEFCGKEYGEPDPANHDLVHHDAKPATCTEIGWDAYDTCKREGCNYTTYEEIDKLGHYLEHHDAKPASCTEIGWKAYDTCKREGCDYSTYEEIDKLGHDLEHHDAKPATCTEDGWPAYDTCKREGCDYTTLLVKQAKLGHDLVHHEAKAATCTEVGWEAYDTCSRCDYSTYKEIPALGHDLVKHDAKAATCTEAGWDAYDSCSRCDYSTFKEIPALGHDIEHHDAKAATCTEDGWPAYDTCKRDGCNYTTLLIMQARLGHDLTHHEGKAATCTENGWKAYDTCKREGCDYSTYKEIPALGHDLTHHEGKAATCTEAGWDAYDTCSRCSYTTYREIAAPGHAPGEPVVTAREEPQVGKAGFEETMIYCTVCDLELEYRYNQLPALPEPVPVPDTKEEGTGKPDTEIVIAPKKSVLRIIQPEFREEEQELELSVIQQFFSDDSGVYFQTEPDSVLPNIPPYALKLIEAKVWRLEKFSDITDRVILDYTGSQEFPLNLDLIMILVYRDDAGEHWEVLKKPTRLIGNRLRAEVDAALVRKLQSRPFAIIVLADNGSR